MNTNSIPFSPYLATQSEAVENMIEQTYVKARLAEREYGCRREGNKSFLLNLTRAYLLNKALSYSRKNNNGSMGRSMMKTITGAYQSAGMIVQTIGNRYKGLQTEASPDGDLLQDLDALRLGGRRPNNKAKEGLSSFRRRQTPDAPLVGIDGEYGCTSTSTYIPPSIGCTKFDKAFLLRQIVQKYAREDLSQREPLVISQRNQVVVLKGSDKNVIRYAKNDLVRQMEKDLHAYNDLVSGAEILHVEEDLAPVPLDAKLFRVFNNGRWDHGGRFYGADHQQLSGERRGWLLIDRDPTIELDYSGLHARMLYHLEGMDYHGDPYAWEEYPRATVRALRKLLFACALNTSNRQAAIKAAKNEIRAYESFPGFGHVKVEDFKKVLDVRVTEALDDLLREHKPIRHRLFKKATGLELQYMDSVIASDILRHFTSRGIVCLPVHDSFIVPLFFEGDLRMAMKHFYNKRMGFAPVIH